MESLLAHVDINTIILTIVGLILGLQQWRSGNSKLSKETVEAYKAQLDITEKRLKDQQETLNTQAGEIGKLKGLLEGKDAQLAQYSKIIENRNPDLEKILQQLVTFMKEVDTRLTAIAVHQQKPVVAETKTTITKQ